MALAYSQPASALTEAESAPTSGQWQAQLELSFAQGPRGCRLMRSSHQGPLYVQKAFYPEGPELAHMYLLHPPGGLVSGDSLRLKVELAAGAELLMTTPGAGRVYRARSDRRLQQQFNSFRLAPGASMEWLPQETIVYPDANASLQTQVDLAAGSRFLGWEINCLGLPANGRAFDKGSLRQRLFLRREGRPLLIENLTLDDSTRALYGAGAGLRSQPVNGILLAGPFEAEALAELEATIAAMREIASAREANSLSGISLVNGFVIGRYLGPCSEQAKHLFNDWWARLRPVFNGRRAKQPRIWAT